MIDAAYERVMAGMMPEAHAGVSARYQELIDGFNYSALDHCLRHYIWAELDFRTPGVRGLGRVSTDTPRFAAHYRRQVGALDRERLAFLYHGIQSIILTSYMIYALLVDGQSPSRTYESEEELYHRWLPLIYSSAGKPKPGVLAALGDMTVDDYERLLEFMQAQRMAIDQTTGKILYYYCVAGVNLRYVETT